MLNISEESGGEEGIQINKTISLCRGETGGIQSGPPASQDYHQSGPLSLVESRRDTVL